MKEILETLATVRGDIQNYINGDWNGRPEDQGEGVTA